MAPSTQIDPKKAEKRPPFGHQEQAAPGRESQMDPKPDYGEATYVGYDRLRDKVALITGADSGIGRAVALAYAREGADVIISYLNEHEDAEETKRAVEDAGRKALLVPGDIGDDAHCATMVAQAVKAFGRIDILVNNAAYQGKQVEDFAELTAERVEKTFRTNIVAMFSLTRHSLPHMKEGSTIINVASIQAYQPSPGILDYAATKGAIVAFSKGLARDLIEKKGIRVNVVAPGPVWTPLIVQSFPAEKSAKFGSTKPMKRPAQPKELAPAFVFLASSDASYINGEVLGVTGGELLA